MQVFQCHYQEESLTSGLYFDYIKDILHAASQGTSSFSCKPSPCLNPPHTPGTSGICIFYFKWMPEKPRQLSSMLEGIDLGSRTQEAGISVGHTANMLDELYSQKHIWDLQGTDGDFIVGKSDPDCISHPAWISPASSSSSINKYQDNWSARYQICAV